MVSAALAATTTERKAIVISTKMIPMTTARKTSWRPARIAAMSSKAAVCPPTKACAGPSSTAPGRTSSRRRCTSPAVSADCGEVVGKTVTTAVSPAALSTGSATEATPALSSIACATRAAVPGSPVWSTATISGPLKPGPNPSASRS